METALTVAQDRPNRVPPQDMDAERSVLGAMMLDEEASIQAFSILSDRDFYRSAHASIFAAMSALYERNEPIDEITVAAQLRTMREIENVGGSAFLASLTEHVPTAANLSHYARIVKDRALARRLISTATAIAGVGYQGTTDVAAMLDDAEAKIFEITNSREHKAFSPLSEAVKHAFRRLEERYERKERITGVPSGFPDFDDKTAGLQSSDLIIIAGRPSMGKTAFALGLGYNAAHLSKVPTAVFSLEMSREQLVMRMLASEARIDGSAMRTGTFPPEAWPHIARAAGELSATPLYIDDSAALNVMEMRAKCRRLQAEKGLGLIIVDYLQLMRGRSGSEGREKEISEISRGLKALAKELEVPVVALSQLNRSLEQRQDKRPMLSDLRESGAIEQDADVICFVYRDEYYNPDTNEQGIAEIIIGKQRNGPTGTVKLRFFNKHVRFESLAKQEAYGGPPAGFAA